jgi:hypothetical protein
MGVLKACIVCGGRFEAKTTALTCSAACWRTREQNRQREYNEANRERRRTYQHEYNKAHREQRLAYKRERRKSRESR